MKLNNIKGKILLASKSPRRSQLLREMGLDFTIVSIDCEEDYPADLALDKVAEYLAHKKSKAYLPNLEKDQFLVTADCIVLHQNQILPKPKNKTEAFSFLQSMRGKKHQVLTGVCIRSQDKLSSFTDVSLVTVTEFTDEEALFYIDQYQPFDKAGAYGIQEWFGHCLISGIEGSYTNIMGLPTQKLYQALVNF